MVEVDWTILLFGAAFAGWVDAIVGGGGLILVPLLMMFGPAVSPGFQPVNALATNKLAAVWGTGSAAITLVRKVRPEPRLVVLLAAVAGIGSAFGALLATLMSSDMLRPAVIVLLVAVGIFVAFTPSFGTTGDDSLPLTWRMVALAALATTAIGTYDGFFGPGTGTFLILALTAILGRTFLMASTLAKVANTATNLGALIVFALGGHVLWLLGLALAVANIAGAQIGARMVLGRGAGFVRIVLLAVVVVMAAKLSWDQWGDALVGFF